MLALEGRSSLASMYRVANQMIWTGIDRWIETASSPVLVKPLPFDESEIEEVGEPDPVMDLIENADGPMVHSNVEGAAKLICVNLISANGGLVELLSPYGAVPKASIGLFGRPVHLPPQGWQSADTHVLEANAQNFRADVFKADGWQELFVTKRLFETVSYGLIDWEIGAVDVATLEEARHGAAQVRGAAPRRDDGFPPLDLGLLALLRPYHGCPVMVPEAWLSHLELEPARSRREEDCDPLYGSLRPHERILEYKRRNPGAKKEGIRQALFSGSSHRKFAYFFKMASEEEPSLSLPGRKAGA